MKDRRKKRDEVSTLGIQSRTDYITGRLRRKRDYLANGRANYSGYRNGSYNDRADHIIAPH